MQKDMNSVQGFYNIFNYIAEKEWEKNESDNI